MEETRKFVIEDTPEKFRFMAEEIVPPLLDLLGKLNSLEAEIQQRSEILDKKKLEMGIASSQIAPGWKELMKEYGERYLELVEPRVVPGFLKYGAASSYGKPTKYEYLDTDPNCKVVFIMKTAQKAVVETHYTSSLEMMHRFALKPVDGKWLIHAFAYGFASDGKWHTDHNL